MIRGQLQCDICANRLDYPSDEGVITCQAFPNGIPRQISMGHVDHRQRVEGDNGITFVPDDVGQDNIDRVLAKY